MDARRFLQLREKIVGLQRERDRAEGALERVMLNLRENYGVESLDDAEAFLKKLRKKAEKAEKTFDEVLSSFEEKWSDRLG